MSSMTDDHPDVVELRRRVHQWLTELVGEVGTDASGQFVFEEGSTKILVRCARWEDINDTIVYVTAPVVLFVSPSAELYEYVALHSNDFPFARLWAEPNGDSLGVFAGWNLVGNDLNATELMVAARTVALAADRFDDELQQRFGGIRGDSLSFT